MKRSIKTRDIRNDITRSTYFELSSVAGIETSLDWQQSAGRLVEILINCSGDQIGRGWSVNVRFDHPLSVRWREVQIAKLEAPPFTTVPPMNAMLEPRMVAAKIQGPLTAAGREHGLLQIVTSSLGGLAILAIPSSPEALSAGHRF